LIKTGDIYDDVGGLFFIKYQAPLKRKYNLFCLTETPVFIVLESIMALKFS